MLTARSRTTQNAHFHLLSVTAHFASSLPAPVITSLGHLPASHSTPSNYSLPPTPARPPTRGPPSFPGLCCLGESALGYLLDWAGLDVSNPLALLTLLVAFPPPPSASRSRKPRRDTSRRYCMGPVPTYPVHLLPFHSPSQVNILVPSQL